MYKLLLFCFLLLAVSFKPDAKVVKTQPPTIKIIKPKIYHTQYDSAKVNVRHFNTAAIDKYRNDPGFNYDEKANAGLSWWQKLWRWIWELIDKLFSGKQSSSSAPSFSFLPYIIMAVAIGLLIFVIIKMAGINVANIFNRDPKNISIPYSESLENIHQITFDEEIEKALGQRNYRLAIRLLYLSTLKQLNDAHFIQWQVDKTNSAYVNELADAEKRQSFSILTHQFEYVWYGDFPVDGQSFQNINTLFHDFKRTLK